MTIDQWIAVGSSLGTLLAAVATFLTVLQMSKQRRISYKPDILIPAISFKGLPRIDGKLPFPMQWIVDGEEYPATSLLNLNIPVHNVGLGAARNLSISWNFDIEGMIKEANQLAQRTMIPGYFDFSDGFVSWKTNGKGTFVSNWKSQRNDHLDFVLPFSQTVTINTVGVPLTYQILTSALIYLRYKTHDKAFSMDFNLPEFKLLLAYEDIGGKQHIAQLSGKVELALVHSSEVNFTMDGVVKFELVRDRASERLLEAALAGVRFVDRLYFLR